MAIHDLPGQMSFMEQLPGSPQRLPVERDSLETGTVDDPQEQWFFQFHEHLLLTVQAIHRLRQAFLGKML